LDGGGINGPLDVERIGVASAREVYGAGGRPEEVAGNSEASSQKSVCLTTTDYIHWHQA
jgi:hypothetical protein